MYYILYKFYIILYITLTLFFYMLHYNTIFKFYIIIKLQSLKVNIPENVFLLQADERRSLVRF